MTAPGFSANIRICLKWESLVWWHLNPFSSLHCFWHISQYHLNFCKPFAFILFDIALGEKKSCLGILLLLCGGWRAEEAAQLFARSFYCLDAATPVTWIDKPWSGSASDARIAYAAVEDN